MGSSSLTKDKPGSSALGVQSLSPWTTRKVPSLLHFDILCMSVWPPPLYYFLYSSANAGDVRDVDLIPGLGRSAGGGHGNPLQYSCLENPMKRRAWKATVHRVAKSWSWLKWLSMHAHSYFGFPRWISGKEPASQCRSHRRHQFDPWVGKIPWSKKWPPTLVFLPGKSYGQRSLACYSPWDCKRVRHDLVTNQTTFILLSLLLEYNWFTMLC